MDFKVGDVVYLKSGGAKMTVSHEAHDGKIACVWHNEVTPGNFENKADAYPPETLELKSVRDERRASGMASAARRLAR